MTVFRFLYRGALFTAPAWLRRKHGREMESAAVEEIRRASREGGIIAALIACLAALADALIGGVRTRLAGSRAPRTQVRANGPSVPPRPGPARSVRDVLLYDGRIALRGIRKTPSTALLVVTMLGLGIGASTALFSVVYAVSLRPMPYPDAERVTHLAWQGDSYVSGYVPAYRFDFWRRSTRSFDAMTTWWHTSFDVGEGGAAERIQGLRVGRDFFAVVGRAPMLGRAFNASDHIQGAPAVAIIGHGLWQRDLETSPGVLERDVFLDGSPHRIVGVLPQDFRFPPEPGSTQILVPLRLRPDPADEQENYPMLARLADGVPRHRADAEVRGLTATFRAEHPELVPGTHPTMRLASYQEIYVGERARPLWILMAATALLLTIACANVANLLLARSMDRREELSLRRALGASRARLLTQLSVEIGLLASLAAGAGLVLANVGLKTLLALMPTEIPREGEIGIDGVVLAATLGVTVVSTLVFGVATASHLPDEGGPASGRSATRSSWKSPTRHALIAGESGLAVILLVGAWLLAGTTVRLMTSDPGFATGDVVTARLGQWPERYETRQAIETLERDVLDRLARDGTVAAAAVTSSLPLERGINMPMTLAADPDVFVGSVEWRAVSPGFFQTLEIPLLRGRAFDDRDAADTPPVVVVNESFVRQYFPDRNPLGERIYIGRYNDRWISPVFHSEGAVIIGVAADIYEMSLRAGVKRTMWVPRAQAPDQLFRSPIFLARGSDPPSTRSRVRRAILGVDPGLPPPELRTMDQVLGSSVAEERFLATLMGIFAALALTLTALGIYSVVAYGVRRRYREVGIRVALGARRSAVVRLITAQGLMPVLLGLALGAPVSVYLARYLGDVLWQVAVTDPTTIAGVTVLLFAVAAIAAYVPAHSAARADPMRSLAAE